MINYVNLRERALVNILLLFEYWQLEYKKINDDEYDFINPTRNDNNFGACRFNAKKGLGADFTGNSFTASDFKNFLGVGFSREDFAGISNGKFINFGFDIIGLCQRLHNCKTYKDGAYLLNKHLDEMSKVITLQESSLNNLVKRQYERDEANAKKLQIAIKTWQICVPINGTLGERYLQSRGIILSTNEKNIRYYHKILNMEVKSYLPALLFKVQKSPDGPLQAIHRIYLNSKGLGKADVNIPKMALGSIKGLGIWFGQGDETLCVVEGPENALSILSLGYNFVVSTIDAANYSNINIPEYVSNIILMPDGDKAGINSAKKAVDNYKNIAKNIKIILPPKHKNNPKWDWNDELLRIRGKGKNE